MSEPLRRFAGAAFVGALGVAAALSITSAVMLDLAIVTGYYVLLAGSWNLLAGYTGQFSFAPAALAAVGAYATVALETLAHLSAREAMPIAALATALAGLVLGGICLRVRGVYLSLVTFAFAGALGVWLIAARDTTGGDRGHTSAVLFESIDQKPFLWLMVVLTVLFFAAQGVLLGSRYGLYLHAIRGSEEVAEGLGVRTRHLKLAVFTYTAFWFGLAGSFFAGYEAFIAPSMGDLTTTAMVIAMAVVGGLGRQLGPVVGVVVLQAIDHVVRGYGAEYSVLTFAGVGIVVMFIARDGLVGLAEDALRGIRRGRFRVPLARDRNTSGGAVRADGG